jgi:hypothetical protein
MILTIIFQILLTIAIGFGSYMAWDRYSWESLFDKAILTLVGAILTTILGIIILFIIWYLPYYGVPEWLPEWLTDFLQYTER